MPSARPATSAARGAHTARSRAHAADPSRTPRTPRAPRTTRVPRPRSRPRLVAMRLPISHIKWDRKFRTVMLVVIALVGYIGVKGALTLLSTRAEAQQQQAIVHTLARENRRLQRQQQSLKQPATIMRDARKLGMVRSGERSYVVTDLPQR